jgi:uncharacterized protein
MRKSKFFQSLALSAAVLGLTVVLPGWQQSAFADNETQLRTINVSGQGKISVAPDIAFLQFGVQTQDKSVNQAQAENAEALQKVYAALEKEHINKEDIQTISYSVNPIYTWDQNKQVFQGYQVEHILRIADRDLADIGQLLDLVAQSGANRIDNIQYDTEKRAQYELKALDLAMDDADQKADYLAKKIGKPIQSIVNIHENDGPSGPIFIPYAKSMADSTQTQIAAGEITISASVDVSYEF